MSDPPEDPRMIAAVDMIRRTGAVEFQLRYQDDETPVVWIAVAGHRPVRGRPRPGKASRFDAAAGMTPIMAVLRLAELLIDGGVCAHCHRPSGFTADFDDMPADQLICWTQWDPEIKTFRRGCA